VARWDVYELIGRVLDHLPAPRQQMVLAARTRRR
jgi:hypothetical protein